MTNENKSDFKSYYPHINVTDYLSERARKMLHDRMARDHEYAETIRREAAVKYYNPNNHVLNMQYFDATDNNIEFAKKYALGTAVRGVDHIDAFDPEKDARQFAQLMSLCNGLVICD